MTNAEGLKMMTRDARKLSPEALEEIRRRAVAAVESGASQSDVARLLGVSRKTVGAWVRAFRRSGEDSFRARTRGRRPGEQLALSTRQQEWTIRAITRGTPDSHGLRAQLWSRQAVSDLVHREFQVLLSPATVGQYLARWGLIDEALLKDMMRTRIATVLPQWRATNAEPQWWVPEGKVAWIIWIRPHTPPPGHSAHKRNLMNGFRNHFGDVNVLQAISHRGVVLFHAQLGPFDAHQAGRFMIRLGHQLNAPLNAIVCHWPTEHSAILKEWSAPHEHRIALHPSTG
ncbi:helix-turn-helix domain-containing protein [Saccharopolyspora sp. ID03-671]|uniref:helix-turn-helix domain-containing protein n=1 Tax=Saccharopolyspora sp. ID03-671 TaxID=3073066 RepID=UPI0032536602